MTMRRQIILLATLATVAFAAVDAVAQNPSIAARKADIEDMLDRGRWGEAYAAITALAEDVDPVTNRQDLEWLEYEKVRAAVELDVAEAEKMMQTYITDNPTSVYRNDMLFMLASYYADNRMMEAADDAFAKVEYMALDGNAKERYDMRVGYIRFMSGDYERAKVNFSKVSKVSDYYPHALYFTSYIHYIEDELDRAEMGFKQLEEHEAYASLIPFYLLQIEYRRGNYELVIAQGEKLLNQRTRENVRDDLERVIAESYFILGDYAQAVRYMTNYAPKKMGRQENYILGYSLYRMTRYEEAVLPLQSVVGGAEDALAQNAAYHLADCYLKLNDESSAADAFAQATASGEGYNENIARSSLLNSGRLKYTLGGGRFNEATAALQQYLERYPNSPEEAEIKELLIASYHNSKNYDAAYAAIKEFSNPDRDIKVALQRVALFRAIESAGRGEWDKAEELLAEVVALNMRAKYTALALYWQGEVAYVKGEMALARQKYAEYIRRSKDAGAIESQYAQYGIGYTYFSQGDMNEAANAFEIFVRDYVKRDDYLYDAQNRLGDARFSLREFASARNAYKVVTSSATNHRHYANYQLAMLEGIDKKQSKKIEMLKSIVNEGVGDYVDDAWYELGRSHIAAERYEEGAATLQDFVDSDPSSCYYINALTDLALAYYNLGRKEEAVACYEKVVAYDPQSASALEAIRSLRDIYVKEDKIDEYFEYAERSGVQSDMDEASRDSLTFAAAKSVYLEGNMSDARTKLANYLETFDKGYNRTEALFYLSDCHMYLKDNAKALETMDELLAHGRNQYTERVLDVYANMSFDMGLYDKSAKAFRALYDESHDKTKRAEASEGYVDAVAMTNNAAAIDAMYKDLATMTDATEWAHRYAKLVMADELRKEGSKNNRKKALKMYKELAENTSTEEGAEAFYRVVESVMNDGDYKEAQQMVYDMGDCGSSYWQAKIFILLGDTFVKTKNTFQARATYQSIVDGYSPKDDGIVDEAKRRISDLPK